MCGRLTGGVPNPNNSAGVQGWYRSLRAVILHLGCRMLGTTRFLLVSAFVLGTGPLMAEAGTLTSTFTTTPNGGQYAPRHVVSVWVEGPGGTFVKTIGRWSAARTSSLVAWRTAAGAADADAVTGATIATHAAPLTVTWDLKDRTGAVIPDGTYTLRMELADSNANAAGQNHQGTFTFVKSTTAQMQTALTNGGFTNVSINIDASAVTPPPPNPAPMDPPSGGGDAGTDSYSAVEGGCTATGGSGGISGLVLLGAMALILRRRAPRR